MQSESQKRLDYCFTTAISLRARIDRSIVLLAIFAERLRPQRKSALQPVELRVMTGVVFAALKWS